MGENNTENASERKVVYLSGHYIAALLGKQENYMSNMFCLSQKKENSQGGIGLSGAKNKNHARSVCRYMLCSMHRLGFPRQPPERHGSNLHTHTH